MSCYFIANIKIEDQDEYQRYIEEAGTVFKKYKGRYLAVEDHPSILEGKWDYSRTVLIGFDTINNFQEWYYSEEYQRILKFRLNGAHCDMILIKSTE